MTLCIDVYLKRSQHCLDFNATMNDGIVGLFGPSGAGKTTLLHIIAGLTKPDVGQITLGETPLFDTTRNINIPAHERNIGLVFQDHLLFPHLNVEKNLMFSRSAKKNWRAKTDLDNIAKILEISRLLKHAIQQLSGGEKQRVALGRAILSNPDLLLLDEPFSGLDHQLKQQVITYLRKLYQTTKIPMVIVSHEPEDLNDLVDELYFIEQGKLFAHGKLLKNNFTHQAPRLCGSHASHDFRGMREMLIRNHHMKMHG